jgi:hypothetical protein
MASASSWKTGSAFKIRRRLSTVAKEIPGKTMEQEACPTALE